LASEAGLEIALGFQAFAAGRHGEAVSRLRRMRSSAHRFGCSHAQRDLIDLTLLEAASRWEFGARRGLGRGVRGTAAGEPADAGLPGAGGRRGAEPAVPRGCGLSALMMNRGPLDVGGLRGCGA
jgi:hypothetical protein